MGLSKWLHHVLNPHCPDCRDEYEESKVCNSCEILKSQLTIINAEKATLLAKLIEKPTEEVVQRPNEESKPIPQMLPWRVRQQMLEREDREKAKLLKDAPKPTKPQTTEELERELGVDNASTTKEAG